MKPAISEEGDASTISPDVDLFAAQRENWLIEQADIASQVVILPEKSLHGLSVHSNARFSLAPTSSLIPFKRNLFGGVDVSFPADPWHPSVAVYVVIDGTSFTTVYQDHEYFDIKVPYIPSFLAFREIDPLQRLVEKQLRTKPEVTPHVILVDGNGILHPRGVGIACFLGVRTGIATIGVGKSLFAEGGLTKELVLKGLDDSVRAASEFAASLQLRVQPPAAADDATLSENCSSSSSILYDNQPIYGGNESPQGHSSDGKKAARTTGVSIDRGTFLPVMAPVCQGLAVPLAASCHDGNHKVLACALVGHGGRVWARGRPHRILGSKCPIYVSVGHKISLQVAVAVCASLSISRIPEPVRQADLIGRELLRQASSRHADTDTG